MKTFTIKNFGCRASQADGAAIAGQLADCGLAPAPAGPADLVVLNSCTVTAAADQDLEKAVRRAKRENPGTQILVTGCYAQRDPEHLAGIAGVTWVVGNSHKDRIGEILAVPLPEASYHAQIHLSDIFERREFFSAPIDESGEDRARPNLKIQDGCNNRCSFCIIPSVRGASRSASADWVLAQVRSLAERYAEIVLTGVNLGRWGREAGGGRQLVQLLERVLDETAVRRLRLSSIEPMDWTDELMELMAGSDRIARHVHAPLQSGSDGVLRRMFRKYRPRHYRDRILRAHQLMPDAAFGADVMTGFPGETDAEFDESFAFIESLPFTYLHVFTYSERPGTRAAESDARVPWEVRKERTRRLRELSEQQGRAFRQRMLGRKLSVVTQGGRRAMSSNFLTVDLGGEHAAQQLRQITVHGFDEAGVMTVLPVLSGLTV
ncbi:MAG: tRNA (N(6)-L-threonylcarbamoyladenosine(37)-C(2))-methylthiotransferase MtaB [Acidobacteria bacterium]|nr:tRNA (N(6)-L-threonylcarbamoyladenosine(37)-C(2))-methylthiotransferase MtaB [Acidobacteriota bacterium]